MVFIEPSRCCQRLILNPLCLPFRHASEVTAYPGCGFLWRVHGLRVRGWAFLCWVTLGLGLGPGWLAAGPSVHDLAAQYRFACAQCHGLDGTALSPSGAKLPGRALADRKWLAKQRDEELLQAILNGKGAMPSFKHKLSPEEAKRLLTEIIRPLARRVR